MGKRGGGGGVAYAQDKIPLQDFARGGLMREGGVFAGHYGICDVRSGHQLPEEDYQSVIELKFC